MIRDEFDNYQPDLIFPHISHKKQYHFLLIRSNTYTNDRKPLILKDCHTFRIISWYQFSTLSISKRLTH